MAQLAEQLLLISEVRSSNPVIGKKFQSTISMLTVDNTKIKEKEAVNDPF